MEKGHAGAREVLVEARRVRGLALRAATPGLLVLRVGEAGGACAERAEAVTVAGDPRFAAAVALGGGAGAGAQRALGRGCRRFRRLRKAGHTGDGSGGRVPGREGAGGQIGAADDARVGASQSQALRGHVGILAGDQAERSTAGNEAVRQIVPRPAADPTQVTTA